MNPLLGGAAEWPITPPLGVDMTGYANRPGPAESLADPLYVRALAIGSRAERPVVLVSLDLLGLGEGSVHRIRDLVAGTVTPARLVLNCTHTHAGPTTVALRCMGQPDAAYCDLVERSTASAIREAVRRMAPARLLYGSAESHIGVNRRELRDGRIVLGQNPAGPIDRTVHVLRVEREDGSALACWFSHACHPVVTGTANTALSAEWPGAAADALRRALGCTALFAQGCCGDINPVTRGDPSLAHSVGRELAGAALTAWERAKPLTGTGIAASLERVDLPQRKPSVEEADAALDAARERRAADPNAHPTRSAAAGLMRWAEAYVAAARDPVALPVAMDVQAVRVGDLTLATTAAETFVEIGRGMSALSRTPITVPLGYTNGCFGYLPTEAAFPLGGYEVEGAFKFYGTLMVTPDCERLTLEAAGRMLRAVSV
jgi:neutral ceramidase